MGKISGELICFECNKSLGTASVELKGLETGLARNYQEMNNPDAYEHHSSNRHFIFQLFNRDRAPITVSISEYSYILSTKDPLMLVRRV